MTDDQVREWRHEAMTLASMEPDDTEQDFHERVEWHMLRLARADAFEAAAKAIRRRNDGRHPIMVSERVEAEKCAKAIETLAAAEKEKG